MSYKTYLDELKAIIRTNRPNLSKSSIVTYASLLKSIYLSTNPTVDAGMTIDWFKNTDNVLNAIKDKTPNSRKSFISAVTVLLGPENMDSRLTRIMNDDVAQIQKQYDSQKMTEKQAQNWIEFQEVQKIERELFDSVKSWFNQITPLSADQMRMMTDWLLIALASGIYFPPRRSEWASIKIKDFNPDVDNYLDMQRGVFVLNQYKTVRLYGREEIPFGKTLGALIAKYLRLVDDQTYLFQNKGKPYTVSYVTFKLNRIFGKSIGTSMLRHIWVSSRYPEIANLGVVKTNARSMGHSLNMHLQYAVK